MAPLLELVLEMVSEAPDAVFELLPSKARWGCLALIVLAILAAVLWAYFG